MQLSSTKDAARQLGVSENFLRKHAHNGNIPHYKAGADLRFNVAELVQHFKSVAMADIRRPSRQSLASK